MPITKPGLLLTRLQMPHNRCSSGDYRSRDLHLRVEDGLIKRFDIEE